jgi:hypothetical protein
MKLTRRTASLLCYALLYIIGITAIVSGLILIVNKGLLIF